MTTVTTQLDEDTIAAVSTPPGRGGIGIVRLSGVRAREIAERQLRLRRPLTHGQARFAEVLDAASGERLDEAVVTYFAGPNSYTAEDVVEIAAHGAPVLLEHLLRQCCAAGARLAEPGEFTRRAFLAGRIDLTQAEAVHDLIEAGTLHQARIAAQQLGGSLARLVGPVKAELIGLIAGLEAGIDFAEDDIEVMPAEQIAARLAAVEAPLRELERSFAYGRVVREGFTLAIVGRPNAGKSSLFNRLVQRERAIVTATPGTTRDLVTERVAIDGVPVELMDTAGLRESSDEAESLGIAKSREAMADADIVLYVVDASAASAEDEVAIDGLVGRPLIVASNKCDLAATAVPGAVATSALTGAGIAELRAAILALAVGGAGWGEGSVLTNLRQQQAVVATVAALERARAAVGVQTPHEMVLLDVYEALSALDSLTGATTSDDILNLIFSSFCIGK